jgi:hypothetical protein
MSLEKLLAQNMLRFGTKNINESQLKKFLLEFYDWTNSGKKNWDTANINDIIKYILEKDKGKAYTNINVYAPIMEWFRTNSKKKSSSTRESLKIWAGDIYEGLETKSSTLSSAEEAEKKKYDFSSYITNVETALSKISTDSSKSKETAALNSFKNLLNAINNKIALNSTNMKSIKDLLTTISSGTFNAEDVSDITNTVYKSLTDTSINKSKIKTEYITDDQRTSLMSQALQQVTEKLADPAFGDGLKLKVKTAPAAVEAAYDITIGAKGTSATIFAKDKELQQEPGKPVPVYQSLKFQYPSIEGRSDDDRTTEAISYFADDKSTPLPAVLDKIKADIAAAGQQIKELRAATGEDGQPAFSSVKVLSVITSAYSSTSWVNSGYQGIATSKNLLNVTAGKGSDMSVTGQYKDPKTGQLTAVKVGTELPQAADKSTKRNVPLAADRCKNLLSVLSSNLKSGTVGIALSSDGGSYMEQPAQEYPNNGPMWTKVGGKNLFTNEAITIANYGPLFQAAYKNNSAITPQQFYGIRNDAAAANASRLLGKTVGATELKAEYEATYSQFRVSGCMFLVQLECIPATAEVPADLQEKEFVVTTAGNFEITLSWSTGPGRLVKRWKNKFKRINWNFDLSFMKIDTTGEGPLITTPGTKCPRF